MLYLTTHFFHERPHTCHTKAEDREALLTELNIVMKNLLKIEEGINYKSVPLHSFPILFLQK